MDAMVPRVVTGGLRALLGWSNRDDIFKNGATTYSSSPNPPPTALPSPPPPLMVKQPDKRLEKLIPLMLVS